MRDTRSDLIRERNNLRRMLWDDDVFAHRWMCHPNEHCKDGCDAAPSSRRLAFYKSEQEVAA